MAESVTILTLRNADGISVNETGLCRSCWNDPMALENSLRAFERAEDADSENCFWDLADNPDAGCTWCGK